MYPGQVLTCGEYATEPDSVEALLSIINPSHWRVRQEVSGWLLHPRIDTVGTGQARIDMILQPTPYLMEAGWRWGFVGVECKKSGTKVGPVLSQAMDYTRCIWTLPNGMEIATRLVFIWPCEKPKSDIESVMAQHRIGVATPYGRDNRRLRLWVNATNAYIDNGDEPPTIANDLNFCRKNGSR